MRLYRLGAMCTLGQPSTRSYCKWSNDFVGGGGGDLVCVLVAIESEPRFRGVSFFYELAKSPE